MACRTPHVALLVVAVAFAPGLSAAQRPALAGEKARVAEAVRADLTRLAALQKSYHERSKLYAADARDLRFTATSGAQVNIAYASMNSWAANASHPTLAPVSCYVIVSANDAADAESAKPFCTEARAGTPAGNVAASTAASTAAPTAASTKMPPQTAPQTQRTEQPRTNPSVTKRADPSAAPGRQVAQDRAPAPSSRAANPPRQSSGAQGGTPSRTGTPPVSGRTGELPGDARLMTREVIAGANAVERAQNVSPAEFADALAAFARSALAILDTPAPVITRDPYESTAEFEARRDAALAAHEKREADFFRENTRTFVVTMPVKDVRYDADREVVEFAVDPVRLPVAGDQLALACYTRPVFWCTAQQGLVYDAGDLWRVPRATARQHDVLRTPMTLVSRYTVGRVEGERALAISLVDMDLQARGQSVQRWPGASR